jgi:multicomponent Na+:H+ antiporter subunit B
VRRALLALGLGGLAAVLVAGLAGLPDFGHYRGPYGIVLEPLVVPQRHVTELVGAVTFDYRGFDTLGEEFILLLAVAGCAALLRLRRAEREREEREAHEGAAPDPPGAAVRGLGAVLVGPITVLGLYLVSHGQVSPGGGFQGGVVIAAAALLAYAAGQALAGRASEPPLEIAEALGGGGFALIACLGLVSGGAALQNVIGLGTAGTILSGGTIPISNLAVGLEVAGGVALVLSEFLDQALLVRRGRRP